MLKNMALLKPPLGIKLTGSISTAGNVASTALWSPYDIVPEDLTAIQISILTNMRRRNPHDGLIVFWVKLRQRGYSRSITGLYYFLRKKNLLPVKPAKPKYAAKPYEQMLYPSQRIQIDVKFVPSVCLVNGAKGQRFYQYTAIDEYSRWRFVEAFEEHSSYSSEVFLEHLIKAFPCPIECVQTDNGQEFTKRFSPYAQADSSFYSKAQWKSGKKPQERQ